MPLSDIERDREASLLDTYMDTTTGAMDTYMDTYRRVCLTSFFMRAYPFRDPLFTVSDN